LRPRTHLNSEVDGSPLGEGCPSIDVNAKKEKKETTRKKRQRKKKKSSSRPGVRGPKSL